MESNVYHWYLIAIKFFLCFQIIYKELTGIFIFGNEIFNAFLGDSQRSVDCQMMIIVKIVFEFEDRNEIRLILIVGEKIGKSSDI